MYFDLWGIQYTARKSNTPRKKKSMLNQSSCKGITTIYRRIYLICSRTFQPTLPTLNRIRDNHEWYFPPKMDDFGSLSVYGRFLQRKLTEIRCQPMWSNWYVVFEKLFGRQSPKLWQRLFMRCQQGWTRFLRWGKIPAGWKASKSQWACACHVCKWFSIYQQVFVNIK